MIPSHPSSCQIPQNKEQRGKIRNISVRNFNLDSDIFKTENLSLSIRMFEKDVNLKFWNWWRSDLDGESKDWRYLKSWTSNTVTPSMMTSDGPGWKRMVVLFVLVVVYLCVGAAIFSHIEGDPEIERRLQLEAFLKNFIGIQVIHCPLYK